MIRLPTMATASLILLPVHLAFATPTLAQAAGGGGEPVIVAGVVRDDAARPVRGALISIPELGRATRTDDAGVYRLDLTVADATVRTVTLRATAAGLGGTELRITLDAGTTWRGIVLARPVVPLDAVVATAVGSAKRRTQVARIERIDAVETTAMAPVSTLSELLQARVAGLSVTRASGSSGASSRIRVRGFGSPAYPTRPALYVDGVRVDGRPRASLLNYVLPTSVLDAISPHDVESVEVLKGPAAAARYGPDAAAGVIDVRTRGARIGGAGFHQRITAAYGGAEIDWLPPANWARCMDPSVPICEGLAAGTPVSDNPLLRRGILREGRRASIHWSGRGGAERYGYAFALGLDTEDGTLPGNGFDRRTGRISAAIAPVDGLRIETAVGRSTTTREPELTGGYFGLVGYAMMGSPLTVGGEEDGWFRVSADALRRIDSRIETERTTPSLHIAHATLPWLEQRLTVGAERVHQRGRDRFPFISGPSPLDGRSTDAAQKSDDYTVNYLATMRLPTSEARGLDIRFSLGAQYLSESILRQATETLRMEPSAPPGPVMYTEQEREWRTFGVLGEWQLGYRDRLFSRAGLRVDWMRMEYRDSSALRFASARGESGAVFAPHVGVSYLISDGSSTDRPLSFVGTLLLHAAWGRVARKHPDVVLPDLSLDPLDVFSPSANDVIANSPMESVSEVELGLESGLLDDRLGIGVTAFRRRTTDIPAVIDLGVSGERGLGYVELLERGLEVDVTARLLRNSRATWDLRASVQTHDNEVVRTSGMRAAVVGYPPFGVREGDPSQPIQTFPIEEIDTIAGIARVGDLEVVGSRVPSLEAAVATRLTLGHWIRIHGLLDARQGFEVLDIIAPFRDRDVQNSERSVLRDELPAAERIRYFGPYEGEYTNAPYIRSGDFVRLREASITFALPAQWASRLGARAASLTLGGRDLALWTDFEGDPEVFSNPTPSPEYRFYIAVPHARRWEARLTVQF
ncbi:MAG TPA: TonB-dependent receptor [Longimicrobiales bacterium]